MIILCATKQEAWPLIEALKMKKSVHEPFAIFENQKDTLLITGIGKIRAAAATSYILTRSPQPVLNVGYAAGNETGRLYAIKKVIDADTDKVYHLQTPEGFEKGVCSTFSKPVTKSLSTLADMEASAIVSTAKIFKQPVTILKIVSDSFEPAKCQKDSSLIERHLGEILRVL